MLRRSRIGDVEDVEDVRRPSCTSPSANSTGAENVLNVPNVLTGRGPQDRGSLTKAAFRCDMGLGDVAAILARGYLRLLTARSDPRRYLSTCLGDTTPKFLDSPLDVSPQQRDEWCGPRPRRSSGAS